MKTFTRLSVFLTLLSALQAQAYVKYDCSQSSDPLYLQLCQGDQKWMNEHLTQVQAGYPYYQPRLPYQGRGMFVPPFSPPGFAPNPLLPMPMPQFGGYPYYPHRYNDGGRFGWQNKVPGIPTGPNGGNGSGATPPQGGDFTWSQTM